MPRVSRIEGRAVRIAPAPGLGRSHRTSLNATRRLGTVAAWAEAGQPIMRREGIATRIDRHAMVDRVGSCHPPHGLASLAHGVEGQVSLAQTLPRSGVVGPISHAVAPSRSQVDAGRASVHRAARNTVRGCPSRDAACPPPSPEHAPAPGCRCASLVALPVLLVPDDVIRFGIGGLGKPPYRGAPLPTRSPIAAPQVARTI